MINLSHADAVQTILDNRRRMIGCSSSETFLRRCVLSRLHGRVLVALDAAANLDSGGKDLLAVIVTAQGIYSDRADWHAFVQQLRQIEQPAESFRS